MIRIGMIGFGNMARKKHIPWIRETGKFEITAASDIVADTGMAAELGVPRYYTDHRDLLADPEVDAVLIASPHDLHREHAVAAFLAGKHVINGSRPFRGIWRNPRRSSMPRNGREPLA